ncbi:ras-related protein Rab-26 isoform X3 [Castor canadensis]|uniref:Ras-related protein Rab-26 isoform X3 n=1 Tax=Castor canadensis TaxID=51338 RepID=A0AC58LFT0_CASCN
MSRKKTSKSKAGSVPAASALPAANGSRPARPGSAHPGSETPPNGPPQPSRPSLGGGGDFYYDVAFKVMLVGDSGVGKTCLLVRFKDGAFLAGTFISTVGIDFRNKVVDVDGMKVKLQHCCCSMMSLTRPPLTTSRSVAFLGGGGWNGPPEMGIDGPFAQHTELFWKWAPYGVCLGVSVPTGQSAQGTPAPSLVPAVPTQAWLTAIQEYARHDVVLLLLGNKVDSAQERVVKREDGEKLAKEYGLPFMETSAKTGLNVDLAFTAIAKELKQRSMKAPSEPRFRLHDYVKREGRGASCCRP